MRSSHGGATTMQRAGSGSKLQHSFDMPASIVGCPWFSWAMALLGLVEQLQTLREASLYEEWR